jgi:hypothetical protein
MDLLSEYGVIATFNVSNILFDVGDDSWMNPFLG